MRFQKDISNADLAWCVVRFEELGTQASLVLDAIYFSRLEDAVQGLTGGRPVTKSEFEASILQKLQTGEAGSGQAKSNYRFSDERSSHKVLGAGADMIDCL